ncbi:Hypothetical protein A7982_03218 [Minicystis rosea]|nr:Hypothetical protein A7982_03218 [Minicystis rosea]
MLVHTDMNTLRNFAGLVALLPLAFGCAARTAPFDQLDRAQVTVLRLQAPQAPQGPLGGALPGLPGVPPELQQMGQAALQGLQNVVPGLQNALPGLIPGQQQQQQLPQFKGYSIVAQMPLADDSLKGQLLDIFGSDASFTPQTQPCFTPGMGFVFQQPNAPEVDLLISFSCNQAKMDGARWPYAVNGFTPQARDGLSRIYEKLFGPVPAGA